jgi:hypothetical protein
VTDIAGNKKNPKLHYQTPEGRSEISINDVEWLQPLNPFFNTWRDEKA